MASRICLGYDDNKIYAVASNSITSYDIRNAESTTTTGGGALTNPGDSFFSCYGHGDQLFIGAADTSANVYFRSYRTSTSPQQHPQVELGSAAFATALGNLQLNTSTVLSMVPLYLSSTEDSDTFKQQPCIVASCMDSDGIHGLYQLCGRSRPTLQSIPFSDDASATPLLATNSAYTSLLLLGYPTATTISVYTNLDDLTTPDTTYTTDIAIPPKGFVQVLDTNATELLIYDYNTIIMHIQLPSTSSKTGTATHNITQYEIKDNLHYGNVIALPDRRVFSVSNKFGGDYMFEEVPFLVSSSSAPPNQNQQQTPQTSASTSSSSSSAASSLSASTLGIIIGCSVGGLLCILLLILWLIRRRNRQAQRYNLTPSKDDLDPFVDLEDKHEHPAPAPSLQAKDLDDSPPLPQIRTQRKPSTITNDYGSSRSNTLRRGLDTFIQRMNSIRSPQSPTSLFSLFSNTSTTPPPVEDKYRKVKQVHFPVGVSELMEPTFYDTNDTLILNGQFHFLDNATFTMEESHRIPGYTTRTIQQVAHGSSIRTLHYYTKDQRNAFFRTVNVAVRLRTSKRIIQHHDALDLSLPTPHGGYQYFWISSLCKTEQSLHSLLHQPAMHNTAIVDTRQPDFIALSALSILTCIRDMHAAEYCHLGLSLRSFYYHQASTITEWYVGDFDQSHVIGQPEGYSLSLDAYSAPELIQRGQRCDQFSPRFTLDIWSLGCILYELVTGVPLFDDFDEAYRLCQTAGLEAHVRRALAAVGTAGACLERMLRVDPARRASVQEVLDDWVKLNDLEDDDLE